MKQRLLGLVVLSFLLTVSVTAQAENEPNYYGDTCTDCALTRDTVRGTTTMCCECKRCNKTVVKTCLNVTKACAWQVKNCDGVLKCTQTCPKCP